MLKWFSVNKKKKMAKSFELSCGFQNLPTKKLEGNYLILNGNQLRSALIAPCYLYHCVSIIILLICL